MLSTQEIYNFLVRAESEGPPAEPAPLPPLPTDALNPMPPMANPIVSDEARIEGLRVRLLALVGPVAKKASSDSVFGNTPGELDPEAEPLDPEWEEILEQMLEDSSEESSEPTVSLRPNKSMSPGAGGGS